MNRHEIVATIPWNLLLLSAGGLLFVLGVNGAMIQHHLLPGGVYGTALLINYATDWLSPGWLYLLLNIPLFALGWLFVGRRFFFYSLYASLFITVCSELMTVNLGIDNELYAAVAGGCLAGAGSGLMLRSLGSAGGLDILAVILSNKWGIGPGRFFFLFNLVLFSLAGLVLDLDMIIASLILVFLASAVIDQVLSLFSQRKAVLIVSENTQEIADAVLHKMRLGATLLQGKGAYSGKDKEVLLTVINNIKLKQLEAVVFDIDPRAMFIVENTFSVLGAGFSKRRIYS